MTTTAITALVLGEAGFTEATVSVDGNRITAVGLSPEDRAALQRHAAEHVDAVGCWLIPGLIDAHARLCYAPARYREQHATRAMGAVHGDVWQRL